LDTVRTTKLASHHRFQGVWSKENADTMLSAALAVQVDAALWNRHWDVGRSNARPYIFTPTT
jgi:hypothetical protein